MRVRRKEYERLIERLERVEYEMGIRKGLGEGRSNLELENKAGLVSKETTEEEKGVGQCPLADAVIAHYDIESQLTRLTESGGQWVRLWPISIKGYDEGHCVEDVLSALRLSVANDPANSPYFSVRDFSTHFKNDEFCLCVHTGLVKTTVFKATLAVY